MILIPALNGLHWAVGGDLKSHIVAERMDVPQSRYRAICNPERHVMDFRRYGAHDPDYPMCRWCLLKMEEGDER